MENIKLRRTFDRGGGYSFIGLDKIRNGIAKNYTFTDDYLFNHGLLELMIEDDAKIPAKEI